MTFIPYVVYTPIMLKIDEIAKDLNVHRNTIINLIKKGEIAAFKIGDQYRVTKESYQKFLEENKAANEKDFNMVVEENTNKLKAAMHDFTMENFIKDQKFRDENNIN